MEQELHSPVVVVLDLGLGSIVSLRKLIQQSGYRTETVLEGDISGAQILLLPGHGSLEHIIELLQERGWYHTLRQHIEAGRPYLGIGAGMHLLFDGTIDGECPGWAILPGNVEKLESWDCSVPHIGYGNVSLCPGRTALRGVNSQVYFAHTHAIMLLDEDADWVIGTKAFGEQTVVTVVNTGKVYGTQFCPAMSGAPGAQMLRSILNEMTGFTAVDVAADAGSCITRNVARRLISYLTVPAASVLSADHLLQHTSVWDNEVLLRGNLDDLLILLSATDGNLRVPITACITAHDHSSTSRDANSTAATDTIISAEKLFRAGADRVVLGDEAVEAAAVFLTTGVLTGDNAIEKLSRKYGAHAVAVSIDTVREAVDNPLNPFDLTGSDADSADCPFPALGSASVLLQQDNHTEPPAVAAADPSVLQIVAETEDEHPELGMLRGMGSTLVHLQSGDHCCWKVRIPSSDHGAAHVYVDAVVLAKACEIMGAGEVYLNIHNIGHFDTPLVNAVQNALRIHVVACGGAGEVAANAEELTRLGSSGIAAQGSIEDLAALCELLSVDCIE